MAYLSWFDALEISIHALREEGDGGGLRHLLHRGISIHALREEGDDHLMRFHLVSEISIHALREEGDPYRYIDVSRWQDFYPRPPRGGRRRDRDPEVVDIVFLSTPSARRATKRPRSPISARVFLSTPSARRATRIQTYFGGYKDISIHALREEGDSKNRDKISIFL